MPSFLAHIVVIIPGSIGVPPLESSASVRPHVKPAPASSLEGVRFLHSCLP